MDRRFTKQEKLKSRKLIESLFKEGRTVKGFPVIAVLKPLDEEGGKASRIGFSVSRRKFKKAVDRNKIKRRMREAYRLNKSILAEKDNSYAIMFIYTGKKIALYTEIEKGIKKIMEKIGE